MSVSANLAYAQALSINDFSAYPSTTDLRTEWSSFGTANIGQPELSFSGVGDSEAAQLTLEWINGDNANLNYFSLSPQVQDLSSYSELNAFVSLNMDTGTGTDTILKLAIQGGTNDSIWQTKSAFAVTPSVGNFEQVSFSLSTNDMELVDNNSDTFEDTISNISSIRLRFENGNEGNSQLALVDSLTAVPEPSSIALFIGLSTMIFTFYFRRRKSR